MIGTKTLDRMGGTRFLWRIEVVENAIREVVDGQGELIEVSSSPINKQSP